MKMKFQIQEITDGMKPYYNMGCLDIATEMSPVEQTGLAVMAISVMHEQTGLSENELEDIMITSGTQYCFPMDSEQYGRSKNKKWNNAVFMYNVEAVAFAWVDPDGDEKFYRITN